MVRTQIQLTEEQSERLKTMANSEGVSVSELVRQSINEYLGLRDSSVKSRSELRKRAESFFGKYSSGLADVSIEHDKYLAEAFTEAGK